MKSTMLIQKIVRPIVKKVELNMRSVRRALECNKWQQKRHFEWNIIESSQQNRFQTRRNIFKSNWDYMVHLIYIPPPAEAKVNFHSPHSFHRACQIECRTHCLDLDLNGNRPGVTSDGNFSSYLIGKSWYNHFQSFSMGGNGNNTIYPHLST